LGGTFLDKQSLIKSKERVTKHGEVFTPPQVVKMMMDQPDIQKSINNLKTTFLEPSAGEGAFLIEILNRRLNLADQLSRSLKEYEENALIGLSTLYGIELLEDNVEMLITNLITSFEVHYSKIVNKYSGSYNKKVLQSAKVIIMSNMVQGNALTHLTNTGHLVNGKFCLKRMTIIK
jgi:type I restriction-modification system DNA methylase subunit